MPKVYKAKSEVTTGLDIGNHSVKCVDLAVSEGKFKLQRATILPLNGGSPDSVIKALKVLFDQHPVSPRVRTSVSGGASLLIRRIQLPAMTHAELKGAIRFEAESHIPFPIDDCLLDFQILNQTPDKKMNVLLVAAKKDFIGERLKLLSTVNIVPEVIDVDIFCLLNAYEALGPSTGEGTFGLLDIGHRSSSFAITQEKLPFFVREIPFGAQGVTPAEDPKTALQKGLEALIDEMRHSIDYFENETGEELKSIWLSGGGSLHPGTAELLSEELGKHVSLWDNTQKLEVFGDVDRKFLAEHSAELNVALGLVLRGAGRRR